MCHSSPLFKLNHPGERRELETRQTTIELVSGCADKLANRLRRRRRQLRELIQTINQYISSWPLPTSLRPFMSVDPR